MGSEPSNTKPTWYQTEKGREHSRRKGKERYARNRDAIRAHQAAYRAENKEAIQSQQRRARAALRHQTMIAYSQDPPRCACCGESILEFLTLCYTMGQVARERRPPRASEYSFYTWLKKHDYPQDVGLGVLCFNCNCARRSNGGICPHQERSDAS